MSDFLTYDVDTQEVANLVSDQSNVDARNGPPSGLTQRATIDTDRNEIYVLTVSFHDFFIRIAVTLVSSLISESQQR